MTRQATPRFLLAEPLPFGKVELVTTDYQEFACSKATAVWLQAGGMSSIDGQPVTLTEVDDFGPNVMVAVRYDR